MKVIIETYVGVWSIMLLMMICLAFTSIHLNVKTANKLYDDVKAQVQASNGAIVSGDSLHVESEIYNNGSFKYEYTINRMKLVTESEEYDMQNNTYIYNDIFKIDFKYTYAVPLFGTQVYPITGYAN